MHQWYWRDYLIMEMQVNLVDMRSGEVGGRSYAITRNGCIKCFVHN